MENNSKLVEKLTSRAIRGWYHARMWSLMTSGIVFFLCMVMLIGLSNQKLDSNAKGCVEVVGTAAIVFAVLNAIVANSCYLDAVKANKKEIKNTVRRRFLKGVDDNPGINPPGTRDIANVVYRCDHCDREYTDPPEILHLHGASGNDYYQVMCPKCWQHTAWYDTPKEAEEAWNKKRRWLLKGSWEEDS